MQFLTKPVDGISVLPNFIFMYNHYLDLHKMFEINLKFLRIFD